MFIFLVVNMQCQTRIVRQCSHLPESFSETIGQSDSVPLRALSAEIAKNYNEGNCNIMF